jgi:hypothetical protein
VTIGNTRTDGSEPPLVAKITGTLMIADDEVYDAAQDGQPVAFGFDEHDSVVWLDPARFSEASASERYLALRFGEFEVEINDPPNEE